MIFHCKVVLSPAYTENTLSVLQLMLQWSTIIFFALFRQKHHRHHCRPPCRLSGIYRVHAETYIPYDDVVASQGNRIIGKTYSISRAVWPYCCISFYGKFCFRWMVPDMENVIMRLPFCFGSFLKLPGRGLSSRLIQYIPYLPCHR